MAIMLIPTVSYYNGVPGNVSGSGHSHSNLATLSKLSINTDGQICFDGKIIGEKAVEVAYSAMLSANNISQCSISLPHDCDTSRSITFALQGIAAFKDVDWQIRENNYPELDVISWQGLGLESVAQEGDTVLITYYKKI